jgi:hypothetical protein
MFYLYYVDLYNMKKHLWAEEILWLNLLIDDNTLSWFL